MAGGEGKKGVARGLIGLDVGEPVRDGMNSGACGLIAGEAERDGTNSGACGLIAGEAERDGTNSGACGLIAVSIREAERDGMNSGACGLIAGEAGRDGMNSGACGLIGEPVGEGERDGMKAGARGLIDGRTAARTGPGSSAQLKKISSCQSFISMSQYSFALAFLSNSSVVRVLARTLSSSQSSSESESQKHLNISGTGFLMWVSPKTQLLAKKDVAGRFTCGEGSGLDELGDDGARAQVIAQES
jgi:hypothetical protein